MEYLIVNGELYHHGIKGQKWGVRRYQNADGSLTNAGKRRYGSTEAFEAHQKYKAANKAYNKSFDKAYWLNAPYSMSKKRREASKKRWEDVYDKLTDLDSAKKEYRTEKGKSDLKKTLGKVNKEREEVLSAREVSKAKLNAKMQKKIMSGKMTNEEAESRRKDYDYTTDLVNKGYDRYASTIENFKTMKIASINDPSIKKSSEYKSAGKAYCKQKFSDSSYGGRSVTVLSYVLDAAIDDNNKR